MKEIVAIWAQDQHGLIGKGNSLPWRLPKDLKHFKETTMGQVILMGRKTFDGMNRRVLPGRTTFILTRDHSYKVEHPDVQVFHSLEDVLEWFQNQDKSLYITGGAEIYALFAPYLDRIITTEIQGEFSGDTYFPSLEWTDFEEKCVTFFPKDEQNAYDFWIRVMTRKG
ncbi:dihydrofolate reductase [Streptococcus ovuberis]|uniref:Dihydrofolate reductase n=1 Tax=Streptococcus ovuberis TaxID=1936207 RepID=A0A7X6RZM8_9STRE|nr:dihydrofolate reductase [Streptococcus ovuberis]NKZ19308.1 dihydrofolate reductase [Streptococcus ovuberis]